MNPNEDFSILIYHYFEVKNSVEQGLINKLNLVRLYTQCAIINDDSARLIRTVDKKLIRPAESLFSKTCDFLFEVVNASGFGVLRTVSATIHFMGHFFKE